MGARKNIVNVVGAVIINEGKLFTAQRNHGKYSGYWEFPGGKIELGETQEEALKREIKEELGADIEIYEYFANLQHDYGDFFISLNLFLCRLVSDFTLFDHSDYKWLEADDIMTVNWLPADLPVIEAIKYRMEKEAIDPTIW